MLPSPLRFHKGKVSHLPGVPRKKGWKGTEPPEMLGKEELCGLTLLDDTSLDRVGL